jgi:hypothetical protein
MSGREVSGVIAVSKCEGRDSLQDRDRWDTNVKIDRNEKRHKNVDWIYQAEDRDQWQTFVNTVMNLWFS